MAIQNTLEWVGSIYNSGHNIPICPSISKGMPLYRADISPKCAISNPVFVPPTESEVRNQNVFGSCVGQAAAFWLSRMIGKQISGSHLWIEGRRIQGDLAGSRDGTNVGSVLQAAGTFGCAPYCANENDDTKDNWDSASGGSTLESTLQAYDCIVKSSAYSISPSDRSAFDMINHALSNGYGIAICSGLRAPFWGITATNNTVGPESVGGLSNGHAQAVWGTYDNGLDVVNSWGVGFGNAGKYRLDKTAISGLWEIVAFRNSV